MVAVSLNRFVVARMILIRNRWKERSKKTKGQRETERVTFAVALTFGFRKKQINTYHGMYVETYKVI